MRLKKKYTDDGRAYWELTREEDSPRLLLLLPYLLPRVQEQKQQPIYILGIEKGKSLREGLTEFALVMQEAQRCFKDASLEGLLKGAIVKEVLEEMNLNPEERYPYLEAQVSQEVATGRYLRAYRNTLKQAKQAGKPVKISSVLQGVGLVQHLSREQQP
jgi:hypothetical protein